MAFQGKQPFFAFLQGTAVGTAIDVVAPAENYILDERVPDGAVVQQRQQPIKIHGIARDGGADDGGEKLRSRRQS